MSNNNTLVLDFEKNIVEIEAKIESLKLLAKDQDVDIAQEVNRLEQKLEKQVKLTYANLTPWQKLQVSRHPQRPHCLDYVHALIEDFTPLCGDRLFGDDEAMIGGIGRFKMDMADKFNMPVIAFVDTDGAFPGIDAEARGQAEAIASSIEKCLQIHVPIISIVIGMGGSGGAIAIATANRILMLEHSIYSVISPEGCASILWRSADKVQEATEALKLTAQDLRKFGVIDEIIKEPIGGAHRDPKTTIEKVGDSILKHLKELLPLSGDELKKQRTAKFLAMGRNLPEN